MNLKKIKKIYVLTFFFLFIIFTFLFFNKILVINILSSKFAGTYKVKGYVIYKHKDKGCEGGAEFCALSGMTQAPYHILSNKDMSYPDESMSKLSQLNSILAYTYEDLSFNTKYTFTLEKHIPEGSFYLLDYKKME